MGSVREARVYPHSRCRVRFRANVRLFECRPLCGQSRTLRGKTPHFAREASRRVPHFAHSRDDVLADKPMSIAPGHKESAVALCHRTGVGGGRCPFNALAPQVNAVCLCSTPRPRQRRFRRLYGHRPAFWPQGQFYRDDTTLKPSCRIPLPSPRSRPNRARPTGRRQLRKGGRRRA
jgi:hypothetical protein